MNRRCLQSLPLAVAIEGCTACTSSNGRGVPDSGAGSDSATLAAPGDESVGEASSDAPVSSGDASLSEAGSDASAADGAPAGPSMASCQASGPGLANCGARGESCCTSLEVSGGTYYRTYDPIDGDGAVGLAPDGGPTGEADPATVSTLRLDKYVVTVGRFRRFVSAWNAGYVPPVGSGKHSYLNGGNGLNATGGGYEPGWVAEDDSNVAPTDGNLSCDPLFATWTNAVGTQENLPINCVNWYEAYAFCIWDGGSLPSEAEWEYAAAGGSEQRAYPWGSAAPGTGCPGGCQYAIYDCDFPNGSGSCTGVESISPVGYASQGAGLWGQLDLAGEVFEWTLDWDDPYVNPCADCADLAASPSSSRVLRGGAYYYFASTLLPSNRLGIPPTYRGNYIGFRCSRSP